MSFWNYLFGKPIVPDVPEQKKVTPFDTIQNLSQQEKMLEKKIDYTRSRIQTLTEQAQLNVEKGDKTKALLVLKQKATLEEQEKSYAAMLDKISHQKLTIEMGEMQIETIKTMKKTNDYLKQSEIQMDSEKAQEIIDDYDEHIQNQNDITRIVSEPLPGTQHLQSEAEAELNRMLEESNKKEKKIVLPEVPNTIPITQEKEKEMEKIAELA
jgi:hypothetical protein